MSPCVGSWASPAGNTPKYWFNFSNPALADWWVNTYIGEVVSNPLFDGVYVLTTLSHYPPPLSLCHLSLSSTSCLVNSRTLMGCANPLFCAEPLRERPTILEGGSAHPISVLSGSVASCRIDADVRMLRSFR